jgi:hypothetical protein
MQGLTATQRETLVQAYCLLIRWGRERLAMEAKAEADQELESTDGGGTEGLDGSNRASTN